MLAVRLPVSGIEVVMQLPTGAVDLHLVESGPPTLQVALGLLQQLVGRIDGEPMAWDALALTDVDVLLLRLRQRLFGDRVQAELRCGAAACGARVDIAFSITSFLDHHRPSTPASIVPGADGWFRLAETAIELRVPTTGDQLAVGPAGSDALLARCVRPAVDDAQREEVEAAMEALAPSLYTQLQGICPACGVEVTCEFDPLDYTLRELRAEANHVYEDVYAIARHLHWSEAEILALPTARRVRYAELAREMTGG